MKILFLDIDGVLNCHQRWNNGYCGLIPRYVWNLNIILKRVKCKIVLTSAWRYMILQGSMTLEGFQNLLLTYGVNSKHYPKDFLLGHTVSDEIISDRESQIIDAYELFKPTCWCIVDDLNLQFTNAKHQKRFVKIDNGLSWGDIDRVLKAFRRKQ